MTIAENLEQICDSIVFSLDFPMYNAKFAISFLNMCCACSNDYETAEFCKSGSVFQFSDGSRLVVHIGCDNEVTCEVE